jgi:hypothetical protein
MSAILDVEIKAKADAKDEPEPEDNMSRNDVLVSAVLLLEDIFFASLTIYGTVAYGSPRNIKSQEQACLNMMSKWLEGES